jgi:hypothetical protein
MTLCFPLRLLPCCNRSQGGCGTSDTWNSGDYVGDTPAVSKANANCAAVDSCIDTQGPDAIQNYMVRRISRTACAAVTAATLLAEDLEREAATMLLGTTMPSLMCPTHDVHTLMLIGWVQVQCHNSLGWLCKALLRHGFIDHVFRPLSASRAADIMWHRHCATCFQVH